MFISIDRMLNVAYWKHDKIRFLLGSLDDHGSSMVQIIIFLRADSPQLYQSEGKGSETRGLGSQCHRSLVQDAGICLVPVWDPFDAQTRPVRILVLCPQVFVGIQERSLVFQRFSHHSHLFSQRKLSFPILWQSYSKQEIPSMCR